MIGINIKQLRLAKGYTQQQVANFLGITRQAVSSYESDRTQPDFETIKRLAELFDVSFEDVLYGSMHLQEKRKQISLLAKIGLVTAVFFTALHTGLLLFANTFYVTESGEVLPENLTDIEIRFLLLNIRQVIEVVTLGVILIFGVLLLLLMYRLERPYSIKTKVIYVLMLGGGASLISLMGFLADRSSLHSFYDYGLTSLFALGLSSLLLLTNLLIEKNRSLK